MIEVGTLYLQTLLLHIPLSHNAEAYLVHYIKKWMKRLTIKVEKNELKFVQFFRISTKKLSKKIGAKH